jgi:hypothetical protein
MRTGVYTAGEGWAASGSFPPATWQTSTGRAVPLPTAASAASRPATGGSSNHTLGTGGDQ